MTNPRTTFRAVAAALSIAAILVVAAPARAQSPQDERLTAAFMLTFGRPPTSAEAARWLAQGSVPVADLVGRLRGTLRDDGAARRDVAARAAHDAFGGDIQGRDSTANAGTADYVAQLAAHIQWLGSHAAAYEVVLQRAYRVVVGRDAYTVELDYWKRQPVASYAMIAGCVENWAVRNQPGLMATAGVPAVAVTSRFLTTARLSPAVSAEARAAANLGPADEATADALGRHVVAPGAAAIASVGGVHFIAVGGPLL